MSLVARGRGEVLFADGGEIHGVISFHEGVVIRVAHYVILWFIQLTQPSNELLQTNLHPAHQPYFFTQTVLQDLVGVFEKNLCADFEEEVLIVCRLLAQGEFVLLVQLGHF